MISNVINERQITKHFCKVITLVSVLMCVLMIGSISIALNNSEFANIKEGKLENYQLVAGKELDVYVTTYKGLRIIYTDNEVDILPRVKSYIRKLPKNMLVNIDEIKMIPFSNTQNIAGTTKGKSIILYNFSKYNRTTQKNIIYHEIAHTWANKLMENDLLDKEYTDYRECVTKDNNYVSEYARDFANENNGKISEDFADAVAFYIMNKTRFTENYPSRAEYFERLFKIEL